MPRDETAVLPLQYGRSRSRVSHPARPLLFVPHSAVRLLDADLRRAQIAKETTAGCDGLPCPAYNIH